MRNRICAAARVIGFALVMCAGSTSTWGADIPLGDAELLGVRYYVPCSINPDGKSCTPAAASDGSEALPSDINLLELNGAPVDTNSGLKGDGTLRCVLATDQPALSTPMPGNITQVAGTALSVNSGVKDNGTIRCVLATDQPPLTTPMPVAISATGASVFPEFDASKVLVPVFADVATGTETSAFTTGCTGACRRVTVCNLGTTGTGCVKLNSGWTTGYPIYPRGATGSPSCLSFYNVSYIAGDTNEASLCTGNTVSYGIFPEDD